MTNQTPNNDEKNTFSEEIEVAGNQLVDRVQDIVRQGNIRRLIIRSADDRVLLETTLTVGVAAGGALAIVGGLPLAVLATIAAAVSRVKIEIIREVADGDVLEDSSKSKVEIDVNDES
jgi:hypothetical protein